MINKFLFSNSNFCNFGSQLFQGVKVIKRVTDLELELCHSLSLQVWWPMPAILTLRRLRSEYLSPPSLPLPLSLIFCFEVLLCHILPPLFATLPKETCLSDHGLEPLNLAYHWNTINLSFLLCKVEVAPCLTQDYCEVKKVSQKKTLLQAL
jgi:hypothetical protein